MDTFRPGPTDSIVRFHLTNFLLENLAHECHVEWLEAFKIPDFLALLEGGCMLTDGRLGFVLRLSPSTSRNAGAP